MARLDSFLELVTEQGASDLHFCAGNVPTIRHDGELVRMPFRVMSDAEARRFLFEILTEEHKEAFDRHQDLDFVYHLPDVGRFRANYFRQAHGVGAVFRIIPAEIPKLSDLDLPAGINRLTRLPNGLVLITGPTGSGKTTTLAAIVNEINMHSARHIITIEDPVEFVHEPKRGVVTQRQVGTHVATFADALRSALRESPDVIVIGEMRDPETIRLALSAAETGALVFGTLHTNSASSAIDRIIDAMPEDRRDQVRGILSVLLRGIVAQHLVRRASGEGRVAAIEILYQSFAVSHMIREGKVHQIDGLLQSTENDGQGMISLDTCLFEYMKQGRITLEDALRVAKFPDQLRHKAGLIAEDD